MGLERGNLKQKLPSTKNFIESIKFEYFETYSFQRKGDFEIYENLLNKYKKDNDSLSPEETIVLKKLRHSKLFTKENNFLFTNNGKLNESAELIYTSKKLTNLNNELIEILKIPFVDYDAWMCPPTYRDAILFFDNNKKLIDGINICFECSNVINLSKKEILTDRIVYKMLEEFLKSLGHKIN